MYIIPKNYEHTKMRTLLSRVVPVHVSMERIVSWLYLSNLWG